MSREQAERVLALYKEAENRRESDPLLGFEPHAKQKAFIDSVLRSNVPENWLIAANRAGKSDAGAYCGAHLARFGRDSGKIGVYEGGRLVVSDRATSGWVSALDFPTSRDVIQPKYFDNGHIPPNATHQPFIPKREIKHWSKTDQILRLKNGSIIGFKSADSGREKYQGAEKDWIHFDEEHDEGIFEEALIRVGAATLLVFCTVTLLPPEGTVGGITWVFPKIIEPWKAGKTPGVELFGMSIYDNPHIPESEILRLEAKYPEGSRQRRIRLNGEWLPGLGGARCYSSFDRAIHVREQPEIHQRKPICWIWDFNVEPMVSLIGQRDQTVFRVLKEIVMDEGSIPEMCEAFKMAIPNHRAEILIYGDATGRSRSAQSRENNYTVIHNEMLSSRTPVRLLVPELNPPVADRINAVNIACRDEFGMNNVEIDPSCEELISDLEQVLYSKQGGIKKTTNKKDPYYKRTHTSDALGYWIATEAPVKSMNEHNRLVPTRIKSPGYGQHLERG